MCMTDFEIIEALIARDNEVTQEFFFERCRPLFYAIIHKVFDYEVDYDEFVNELYIYLLENDATRLRQFEGRSSLLTWLKVTVTRFFIRKRDQLIENQAKDTLYEEMEIAENHSELSELDVQRLLLAMPNRRYSHVVQRLFIDEYTPEELAAEMHITTDNLYNIKRRAMRQLMQVALNDIRAYGKK